MNNVTYRYFRHQMLLLTDNLVFVDNEDGTLTYLSQREGTLNVLDIPEEVDGKKVTRIDVPYYSERHSTVLKVIIPKTITYISEGSFETFYRLVLVENHSSLEVVPKPDKYNRRDCANKKVIVITKPDTEGLLTFDGSAYYLKDKDSRTLIYYVGSEKEYTLPADVKEIGNYAFNENENLESIVLHSDIEKIGAGAFEYLKNLKSITFPAKIEVIPDRCCKGCNHLSEVKFLGNVRSIGEGAFSNCARLAQIEIPRTVTTIKRGAFARCVDLKQIKLPVGLRTLGERAFFQCLGLESIKLIGELTEINEYAFYECMALKKVTLGRKIKSIGCKAFSGCEELREVVNLSKGLKIVRGSTENGLVAHYADKVVYKSNTAD